jgi:hypothetical protein
MHGSHKLLSLLAASSLVISAMILFSTPVPGAACAMLALLLSIYLKICGAFNEGNTPLLGALLIGGSGILSIGGGLVVLSHVSERAAIILYCLMLVPGFGLLIVFGYRERWRRFQRWVEQQSDEPPP